MELTQFAQLPLHDELIHTLDTLGYESMTPIQAQSLPHVLEGKDVIAQAKTGSGKTAAFGLGLLNKLNVRRFRIQSLVLCPTRELADQVAKELRKLARGIHNIKILTLCGGVPMGPQIGSLEHGAHIIVGTPGRIEDHLSRGTLDLTNVETLVLDEADRMLEMGFNEAVDNIIYNIRRKPQTLLFSATFPEGIAQIANDYMARPEHIKVAGSTNNNLIKQHFFAVSGNDERPQGVMAILQQYQPEQSVVFCNTKAEVKELTDLLINKDFSALPLHGDLDQRGRDQTLVRFANGSARVLVATDVAARGLDISDLDMVINYHLARDTEVHVHRVGRTGRAGKEGMACSLYNESREHRKFLLLEEYLEREITVEPLPQLNPHFGLQAKMVTLEIDGGKKHKVRPGDIVGALTAGKGITGDDLGKIALFDMRAFVAVKANLESLALKRLEKGKIKGKTFKARVVTGMPKQAKARYRQKR
ncbi:ATP-dependent RNA helicase DbpA [Paraferrimonas sp. SM1919]|uniref:ATP-dependent RNA helicase DbpA n=1 Tax=Paraferrimonas sp. SM1919 TaxID=2662263 RepID=UPI0013D57E5D|nr:ATP-dependent RNA helicase DbpA [Paraferrimonas sp. SM1919]